MKVIAGCNGYKAQDVADRLKDSWPVGVDKDYELAREVGFGCKGCLVVITATEERFDGDEDLFPRYRDTFDQPEFNPRWEHGTADHIVIIDV